MKERSTWFSNFKRFGSSIHSVECVSIFMKLLDANRTIQDVVVVCGAAHVMGLERQWGVEYTASEREEILRFLTTCPKPFEDDGCPRCTPKYIR